MEIHKYVPFLQHIIENGTPKIEGTRFNPKFVYTGHGERNDSVIFHTGENCMYRKIDELIAEQE